MSNQVHREGGSGIGLGLILALVLAGMPADAGQAEGSLHQELSGAGKTEFSVETVNGGIKIAGADGDQVVVDARVTVQGRKEAVCRELLGRVSLSVEEKGERIHIEPDLPSKWGYSCSVSFDITLPRVMSVAAESVNGDIRVSGLAGSAELETVNGSISAVGIAGGVEAESINGAMEFISIGGALKAEVINGSISVACGDTMPADLSLETINGSLDLDLARPPNAVLSAESISGRVEAE
jgi:DUF4097 and DUF4098 domain-containing protein YvlB